MKLDILGDGVVSIGEVLMCLEVVGMEKMSLKQLRSLAKKHNLFAGEDAVDWKKFVSVI